MTTTTDPNLTNPDPGATTPPPAGEKLYAGKFKTVDELESGYKSAATVYQANQNLTQQLEAATKVPEDYVPPANITMPDADGKQLKEIAKKSGLTQKQFDAAATALAEQNAAAKQLEVNRQLEIRKQLGDDKIALVNEFVAKAYPAQVADAVMKQALSSPEAFTALMAQRDVALNSGVPGMSGVGAPPQLVTQDTIIAARNAHLARPGDMKAREAYLNLIKVKAGNAS